MKEDISEILNICDEFLQIPSVTCFEKPFLDYLDKKIKKLGYSTILKEDYLIVNNQKQKAKNLFSVHVDRQGLLKNKKGNIEYAAFAMKKEKNLKFKREEVDEKEKNLVKDLNERYNSYEFKLNDIYLRIINKDKKNYKFSREWGPDFFEKIALRYVRENISSYDVKNGKILEKFKTRRYDINLNEKEIFYELNKKTSKNDNVFMLNSSVIHNEEVFSAQIDNVISVAVIYYLLKNTDFTDEVIFTTQEEIGQSWKCIVNYLKDCKKEDLKLLVLDTSPYTDMKQHETGFITLRYGDENGGFEKDLVEQVKKLLEKENIPFDFKPSFIGKTELGRVATYSNKKVNGTTLQLPTTNYHTTYETATLKSLENYLKIIKKISKNDYV